jgi:phosphoribosylamine--glycine ligase
MRVLFLEKSADGLLDLAIRASENHEVRYFMSQYNQHTAPVGRGLVERSVDWRRDARWAELIVVGGNDYCLPELDRLRKEGKMVVGSSAEAESWESDRERGMRIFRAAGIPVPPYRAFNSYDDAIAHVKKHDQAFASKPSGKCDDKAMSYVGKSPEDLVYILERWKRAGKRTGLEFILQEKIEGVEFAVGAWFGPGGFVEEWEENFEHKKLFPGSLGPNTGEMGTVSRWVAKSKLADAVLKPLETFLHRAGFIGCVDVSVIVDDDGTPWPLEFTTRGGWPALNLESAAFDCDFVEFFHQLASGKVRGKVHKLDEVYLGIVMALPDFPYSHATRKEVVGVPIYGLSPRLLRDVHFCQAMMGEAPQKKGGSEIKAAPIHVSAGDYVAVVTGSGTTVQAAQRLAYRNIKNLSMPSGCFWRNDIGLRCKKDIGELQRHGFASGMTFS